MGLYGNYNLQSHQFFARGHLTPKADFATDAQRVYTMITTNIAPQWQLFNGGNWNYLETALRSYATQTNHALYVFTGTGKALKLFLYCTRKRTRICGIKLICINWKTYPNKFWYGSRFVRDHLFHCCATFTKSKLAWAVCKRFPLIIHVIPYMEEFDFYNDCQISRALIGQEPVDLPCKTGTLIGSPLLECKRTNDVTSHAVLS